MARQRAWRCPLVNDRKDCLLLRRQNTPALLLALALPLICSVLAYADPVSTEPAAPAALPPSRITNDAPEPVEAARPTAPPSRLKRTPARTDRIVRTALSMRGRPYRYGGTGRGGFDCSGLMKHLYATVEGIHLPRTSAEQSRVGREVSRKDLQPGDLLFFRSRGRQVGHVAMYIGDDKMVHAVNPRRGVTTDRLFGSYWGKRLVTIRRPAPKAPPPPKVTRK